MTYQELRGALDCLGLPERATREQIKLRYRALVKEHHPDRSAAPAESIRRINAAYELLSDYCGNYRYCFSEEEFLEQIPEERLRRQFGWDPVWGGAEKEG